MTPTEINNRITALQAKIGPRAYISISITTDYMAAKPVRATIYPEGILAGAPINCDGVATFEEVILELENKWLLQYDKFHRDMLRKMALKIIDLTSLNGACSDAALRMTFSQDLIDRLGKDACELAADMAASGPFAITKAAKPNAPTDAQMAA